jgi:acyl carrier protein
MARLLPKSMVPAAVVVVDALPRTANGKLDRAALPAPDYAAGAGEFVAPRTEDERVLAQAFADVLGIDRVGLDDSFFDLGGHSLLAAVLTAQLAERFGVELTLNRFLRSPSVRAINEYLGERQC